MTGLMFLLVPETCFFENGKPVKIVKSEKRKPNLTALHKVHKALSHDQLNLIFTQFGVFLQEQKVSEDGSKRHRAKKKLGASKTEEEDASLVGLKILL
jgi:hypothetical protein